MATRLKEVDAVMVGMGWTGSILARELTKAGLTVIGLERGEDLSPRENFALPAIRDELRYSYRLELIQDPALETVTFRHRPSESASGHSCRVTASAGPPITGAASTGAICRAITPRAAISSSVTAPIRSLTT